LPGRRDRLEAQNGALSNTCKILRNTQLSDFAERYGRKDCQILKRDLHSIHGAELLFTYYMLQCRHDPILKRFRDTLDEVYGQRLERVVLYGSRARGDAREDPDYDVAVFCATMRPAPRPNYTGWPTSVLPFSPTAAGSFTRCPIRPAPTMIRACP
jgi:Nucleotidyltransferase domain